MEKIIHYCWFGNNDMPELALKCIDSWKKFFPDYKIIKCFECHALGLKLPYDIKELHEERQQLRDSINILQGKEN